MKNSDFIRNCISGLLLIFGSCLNSYGQFTYPGMAPLAPLPGFVVLMSGDTILGEIACGEFTENFMADVKFTGKDGIKTRYSASGVKGMGICLSGFCPDINPSDYFNWDIYEIRPSPKKGEPVFMPRISDGRIKIFMNRKAVVIGGDKEVTTSTFDGIEFEFSNQGLYIGPTYTLSYAFFESRTRYSSYYFEKDGSSLTFLDKGNYEALWDTLFGDCAAISGEVDQNPDLKKFKNFLILAEVYNRICP